MTYFTEEEGEEKRGKKIRALRAFADVPKYTNGVVTACYKTIEGYGLDITWDLPTNCSRPLTDGFSKDEYYEFLQELY